jgi:hypothetical protein
MQLLISEKKIEGERKFLCYQFVEDSGTLAGVYHEITTRPTKDSIETTEGRKGL